MTTPGKWDEGPRPPPTDPNSTQLGQWRMFALVIMLLTLAGHCAPLIYAMFWLPPFRPGISGVNNTPLWLAAVVDYGLLFVVASASLASKPWLNFLGLLQPVVLGWAVIDFYAGYLGLGSYFCFFSAGAYSSPGMVCEVLFPLDEPSLWSCGAWPLWLFRLPMLMTLLQVSWKFGMRLKHRHDPAVRRAVEQWYRWPVCEPAAASPWSPAGPEQKLKL